MKARRCRASQLVFLLGALLIGTQATAFDGGGHDETSAQMTHESDPHRSRPDYASFHAECLAKELRMWGDVAELMHKLATAQCTCEYISLEQINRFDAQTQERISNTCARRGGRQTKAQFIQWALPLHQQRLQQAPEE